MSTPWFDSGPADEWRSHSDGEERTSSRAGCGYPRTAVTQPADTDLFDGLMERGVLASTTPARAVFAHAEAPMPKEVIISVGLALTKHSEFQVIEVRHQGEGDTTRISHSLAAAGVATA